MDVQLITNFFVPEVIDSKETIVSRSAVMVSELRTQVVEPINGGIT